MVGRRAEMVETQTCLSNIQTHLAEIRTLTIYTLFTFFFFYMPFLILYMHTQNICKFIIIIFL